MIQLERARDNSKHEAFGYEHADDAITRRAEREANGDFTIPRRRARKQQRRDIGAGDQKDQVERAEEEGREQKRIEHLAKSSNPFDPGTVGGLNASDAAGIHSVLRPDQRGEFGADGRTIVAGRDAPSESEPEVLILLEEIQCWVQARPLRCKGSIRLTAGPMIQPEVVAATTPTTGTERLLIWMTRPMMPWIGGEAAAPGGLTQDSDWRLARRAAVVLHEKPAKLGARDAFHREEIAGNGEARNFLFAERNGEFVIGGELAQ